MGADTNLSQLIRFLHEAVMSPERLDMFLRAVIGAFEADAGHLTVADPALRRIVLAVDQGFESDGMAQFIRRHAFDDEHRPWFDTGVRASGLAGTGYFTQSLRPQGISDGAVVAAATRAGPAALALFRRDGASPFLPNDFTRLDALAAHFPHALGVLAEFARHRDDRALLGALVETVGWPMVVVDAGGRLVVANAAGREVFRFGDVVVLHDGRIQGIGAACERLFAKLIREGSKGAAASLRAGGTGRRIGVMAQPVPQAPQSMQPLIMLSIHDPALHSAPPEWALRGLFDLSAAEASLLIALVQDKRLEDHAQDRSISVATARTQLSHLFRKTGTNRQSELVRLAQSSVAGLAFAGGDAGAAQVACNR